MRMRKFKTATAAKTFAKRVYVLSTCQNQPVHWNKILRLIGLDAMYASVGICMLLLDLCFDPKLFFLVKM